VASSRSIDCNASLCSQSHLQLRSARSCDATAQRQPTRTGADLVQAVFDGVLGTFWLGTVLHRRTLRSRRFNPSAVFTAVSCSRHSVPRTRLELGKRAFAVAAPAAWNNLLDDVRSAPTLDKFKQCLKTHLFNVYTVILLSP